MAALVLLLLSPLLGGMGVATAQGAHPFGVPESGAGMGGPGWLASFFGQVAVWQSHFYRQLTGAVRAWQADGGAAWTLIGLSFAYGVFHALGPGHGKAVISSYVVANRQTARNGALLALASALIQALVAIVMVAVLALVFNATATTMNQATRWLELASYGLVTLLGVWLVWIKAVRPLLRRRREPVASADAHHHHHHHDDCGCGHAHVPAPDQVAGQLNWRRAMSAILAVGLRPCSGALIVLVFALSQGFVLAGVASALAMGLGTGLTVAALACLAVAAGGAATRIGQRLSSTGAARVRYGVEALAAVMVLLLGVTLLGGMVAGGG
ncbi:MULTISPECIES: nickel/cobalt transporter [Achromobacter]|uniref:Nickel/cobalt efflux system n=1 Tax=Achromobacter spanius TaxID=217203 RepID=A0ABY8H312_9BURK|nr:MULTISPECIES: nickel/cobalt transporter [Achromobacter]WAI86285.1 nickel/cobalt transporter [Achromobacter spanius]WEX97539.1 nickel/cobalt transporter [Achromobacter sp. SS2-2022]WFP11161.1 nickel/cobalt transporter [Achromobacter spanius]